MITTKEAIHYILDSKLRDKPEWLVKLVVETVYCLPFDVQRFIEKEVEFFSGETSVISIKQIIQPETKYVVILNSHAGKFAVAHEIAHAYLGHCDQLNKTLEEGKQEEKKAKWQARKWLNDAPKP